MRRISKAEALALVAQEAAAIEARFAGCAMCGAIAEVTSDATGERAGSGEASARRAVLAQNAVAVAMLDRFAARPGHVVVVLRRHAEAIADLPWDEYAAVQRLAWEASRALTAVLAPVRVYVAALGATRRIATSFPHHHVHVIPLTDGGEADRPANVLTWSHGIHVYEPDELAAWSDRLRAAWPG
jgi:diadenosine tetraphosphate (Ap4A) HIT family hydrolase